MEESFTINDYLTKMQKLQDKLISFITTNNHSDEDYENLANFFDEQKIRDQHEFKAILHLIVSLSNNYHRNADFFTNIEQILLIFQNEIQDFFSNDESFLFQICTLHPSLLHHSIKKHFILIIFRQNFDHFST